MKNANPEDSAMKDGLRFVDCDMHIMEPVDLFDKYLDKKFRDVSYCLWIQKGNSSAA